MDVDRKIRRLLRQGVPKIEISRRCGLSVSAISRRDREWHPRAKITAEEIVRNVREEHYRKKAVQLVKDGCELRWASEQAGIQPSQLRRLCRSDGVEYETDSESRWIYALVCPVEKQVRYIGAALEPYRRHGNHLNKPPSEPMLRWIQWLKAGEKEPVFVVIENAGVDWREVERKWIQFCIRCGHDLFNIQLVEAA